MIAQPGYDEPTVRRLGRLHHDGQPLDPGNHAGCPGHAAYVTRSHGPERAEAVHVCVHPRVRGHTDLTAHSGSTSGPLTEAEKADRKRVRDNNVKAIETFTEAAVVTRRVTPVGFMIQHSGSLVRLNASQHADEQQPFAHSTAPGDKECVDMSTTR